MIGAYPSVPPTTADTQAARARLADLEAQLPELEKLAAAAREHSESLRQVAKTDSTQYPDAIKASGDSVGADALLERHRADLAAARETVFAADGQALDALQAARIAELEETLFRDAERFDYIVSSTNAAIRQANAATAELFQRSGNLQNEYQNLLTRRREFAGLTLPDAGQEFFAMRQTVSAGFSRSFNIEPVLWRTERDF